jgi:hypothetical protein
VKHVHKEPPWEIRKKKKKTPNERLKRKRGGIRVNGSPIISTNVERVRWFRSIDAWRLGVAHLNRIVEDHGRS